MLHGYKNISLVVRALVKHKIKMNLNVLFVLPSGTPVSSVPWFVIKQQSQITYITLKANCEILALAICILADKLAIEAKLADQHHLTVKSIKGEKEAEFRGRRELNSCKILRRR